MTQKNPRPHSAFLVLLAACACGSLDPKPSDDVDAGGTAKSVLLPLAPGNRWTYRVTDGNSSGGSATGGSSTGGSSTGGSSTGGSSTGGSSTGGSSTGGSSTGGASGPNNVETKEQLVGELERVGGSGPNASVMAFRVTTTRGVNGTNETVSWQAAVGARVVRYREQAFNATSGTLDIEEHWDPYKLRVDQAEEFIEDGASFLETYDETKLVPGMEPTTATRDDRWTVLAASESVTVPAGTFDAIKVMRVSSSQGAVKTYWFAENVGKVKEEGGQLEELESYEVSE